MVPLSPIPSMVPGDRELGLESVGVEATTSSRLEDCRFLISCSGPHKFILRRKCAQEAIPQEPEEE